MSSDINTNAWYARWDLLGRIWRGPERWLGIVAVALIAFCAMSYSNWAAEKASHWFTKNKYVALLDGMSNPMRNRHILMRSGLPVYDLKIGRQEYARLEAVADEALAHGWMNDELKTWVNARLFHENETYDVQVRLRGDLNRHWKGPKKSYRIKFGTEKIEHAGQVQEVRKFFEGKRQINLIVPHDKLYALGPFINDVMEDANLVVPRDRFVILRINGVLHGLYYEVEHFDKPLLAANERPETTVFGQNTRPQKYEKYAKAGTPAASDAAYDLGAVRRQVEPLNDLGFRAVKVLIDHSLDPTVQNFQRVRQVLDWDKYLHFRAMTTICNTNHVRFGSDNLKLFYDASRGLLEPIPWDVLLVKMPREPGTIDFYNDHGTDEIQKATLRDPQARLERNRVLWDYVSDGGDSLLARYDRIHNDIRLLVWADVLSTPVQAHKMDAVRSILKHNLRRIHHVLDWSAGNLTYRLENERLATLEFATLNFSGLRLEGIELADSLAFEGSYQLYEDTNHDGVFNAEDVLVGEDDADAGHILFALDREVLPEVEYGSGLIKGRYWEYFEPRAGRRRFFLVGKLAPEVRHPLEWQAPYIEVSAVNAVTELPVQSVMLTSEELLPDNSIGITAWDGSDLWDLDATQRTLAQFLEAYPQFRASSTRPGAAELRGAVTLDGSVIVPRSVALRIAPGTDLTLTPGTTLLCYGGFESIGTPDARIRIRGREGAGAWGVLGIVRPSEPVRVHYTDFSDASQAQANGILFTGGFAVHEGDLELWHSTFSDMHSEDAINIKNGHVDMSDCLVQGAASDGIDIDMGTGEVRFSRFLDIAGDGIDMSFSNVTLRDNHIENIRDKGISVGERSRPALVNNLVRGCSIGISCKDLSYARVAHCTFVDNALAIEAKRKKPMFGGGSGEFVNCVFAANDTLLREDWFSNGKIKLDHVLTDDSNTNPVVEFVAPDEDDYRLDLQQMKVPYEVVDVPWLGLTERPAAPGVFDLPDSWSGPVDPQVGAASASHPGLAARAAAMATALLKRD